MSLFEWLALGLLLIIAVLAVVAICVASRAACNARDAKVEAEHERLLVKGTGVTADEIQAAVEQVLHDTGALEAIHAAARATAMIATGDHPYSDEDRRQLVPASSPGYYANQQSPDYPLNGYREVQAPARPTARYETAASLPQKRNGRLPALAGAYQQATPFGYHDQAALRRARDPLGTHPVTDTLTSMDPIKDDPPGVDPETDVHVLERRWQQDAESTQSWSLAFREGSGEQPLAEERRDRH